MEADKEDDFMREKRTTVLFLIIFFIIVTAMVVLSLLIGRIPKNPPGTVGNTAGNLNNKGLFCEDENIVYFSNAYDNGSLYSMNTDETEVKKISSIKVEYINAAGKFLYYYQSSSSAQSGLGSVRSMSGVYRSTKSGGKITCFNNDPSGVVSLIENNVFYQHYDPDNGMTLYKQNISRSGKSEVAKQIINPASSQNGVIYFNGVEKDHNLYALNTVDHSVSLVLEYSLWNPIVQDDYVYFMDVSNNYRLSRYQLSSGEMQVLAEDRIDFFNVYGNLIYYQASSPTSPALKRMNIDGTNIEIVDEGVFENINITSAYVYYNEFDNPIPVFKTPVSGPVSVTTFDMARDAALNAE